MHSWYILLLMPVSILWADISYMPYHTSHFRVHRDKNNQDYAVEFPTEAYSLDDPELSVPSVIIPPKPTAYTQEYDPNSELDVDDDEPELMMPDK